MTKNQINYILGLATVAVIWLFFNTFYIGAKTQARMFPMSGRPPMPSTFNLPPASPRTPGAPATDYMASLPPEAQKILAERRAALATKLPTVVPSGVAGTTAEAKKK